MLSRRWTEFPATRDIPLKELLIAALLGVVGLSLNSFELKLGWGMNFILGNALVYAFVRMLAPQSLVLLAALPSSLPPWTFTAPCSLALQPSISTTGSSPCPALRQPAAQMSVSRTLSRKRRR